MKKIYTIILTVILCINMLGCGKIESTPAPTSNVSLQETPDTEPTAIPELMIKTISFKQDYSDSYRTVELLGLKEYNKIKGDNYTDIPKKGNKFLVLFLSIRNESKEDDYINYNCISAKLNGKKNLEHTYLLNEPRKYPTIFKTIPAQKAISGFIVWEVPANWKTFEFSYSGWENVNNLFLQGKLTKKDLCTPPIYNAADYE